METERKNREVVGSIGDLVENLYNEVAPLPISDAAKNAMVMVMVANVLKCNGCTVTFQFPLEMMRGQVAA